MHMAEGSIFAGKYPTEDEMADFLKSRGLGQYANTEVTPQPPMGDGTPGPLALKLGQCTSANLLKFGPRVFDIAVKGLLEKEGVEVVFDTPVTTET